MDFTLKKYAELLDALKERQEGIILRHDVDLKPDRSLEMARLEAAKGWKAVYYFRAVPQSWDEGVIRQIAAMGHEIGYHYESLTTCNGDVAAAWEDFKTNLERLREVVGAVHSICMHGSPRSKWDSKNIWHNYNYREVGVDFEPYLDTDWAGTFYLTDTGRRWDGWKVSVRDKIPLWQEKWAEQGLVFHSTDDIIRAAKSGTAKQEGPQRGQGKPVLPQKIMITTHPQRWMPFSAAWVKELVLQNAKNTVKRLRVIRGKA